MIVTRRGALVAALSVPVVATLVAVTGSAWVLAGGLVAVVVVLGLDVALTPSPKLLTARRGGEESVRLGESAQVELTLTNLGRRPTEALVRDAWVPSAGARDGIGRLQIPARQRRRRPLTLVPTRRGDRTAGPVVVRVSGPLGLAGRQAELTAPWTVRALPPFEARKHLPSRLARLRELDGRATILQRGQGTEFDSLREYVPGDDVRSIDWRGTARSSTVVVRTWRPERDRHVLIVLDSGRTSAGRVGDQPRLDHAMDAALLLAALASRAGDRVDLVVVDRAVRVRVLRASAADVLARCTDALAGVDPVLAETDHRLLANEILQHTTQRSLVVLLTGLDAAALTEGLLPVIGPVVRRHTLVLAAVSDPRVDELAAGREDASQAYQAAAAEVDRARRRSTVQILQKAGITVVEAPPETFAPAVSDHYLALKKAGRL